MADWGFWRLSAAQLMEGYSRRDFVPSEVTREIFYRIDRLDKHMHAYLALNFEDAMAAATRADETWQSPGEKPLLCGVPVSVKDTIEMKGLPTTYGSLAFKDNMQDDSEIVLRLRRAGAVIIGKTNTPEFALHARVDNRLTEPGANPWHLSHTCGGSSGGAGAAVASGLGPLAVGTDSGGSIRGPAAYNGIYGLKPTFQRVPAVQVWRASPARSHNGPMTRTVRDSALMMQALAGVDPRDPDSNLPEVDWMSFARGTVRGAKVALSYDFGRETMQPSPEIRAAVDEAASLLRDLGCTIVPANPPMSNEPEQLEPGVWAYSGDHYGAAEAMIPGFWEKHKDDLTDYARPVYEAGQRALAWQYRRVLRRNRALNEAIRRWFLDFDFLLCPCTGPAPLIGAPETKGSGSMTFLNPFNHSYNPAAAVPFGFTASGLPIAVQIVGRHSDDLGVLRLSAQIEAARPWGMKWPKYAEAE